MILLIELCRTCKYSTIGGHRASRNQHTYRATSKMGWLGMAIRLNYKRQPCCITRHNLKG